MDGQRVRATRRDILTGVMAAACGSMVAGLAAAGGDDRGTSIDAAGRTGSPLPFDLAPLPKGDREVFAHWHFFPISIDNQRQGADYYDREYMRPGVGASNNLKFGSFIRERPLPRPPIEGKDWLVVDLEQDLTWAAAIGLDGFFYNIITIDQASPFWKLFINMLDAGQRSGTSVRVIPNLDATLLANQPIAAIAKAIKSVADHRALLRRADGRVVLGAFAPESWPAQNWLNLFADLRSQGVLVEFVPTFLNAAAADAAHWQLADMVSEWSGNYLDGVAHLDVVRSLYKARQKKWCSPVWPQDFRPKDGVFGEAGNSRLFREAWMSAIRGGADCAQLLTWNDYSESSAVRPSSGIQYSFYDLAAYYVAWFKSGRPPPIQRDVLYYFHRVQPAAGRGLGSAQSGVFSLQWGRKVLDEIELLAFLARPGEIEIDIVGNTRRIMAPAGVTSLTMPLQPGRPAFRLIRDGQTDIACESAFVIVDQAPYQNLLYHGGSSSRPAEKD